MKIIVATLLLFSYFACSGQDTEWLNLQYDKSFLKHNDTAAQFRQIELRTRLPLSVKNNRVVALGIGYKNGLLQDFPSVFNRELHGLSAQILWMQKISDRKSILLFGQAGFFSDFQDGLTKSFRYAAGVRFRTKHSDRLTTGLGLAYARQFFGNQIIPYLDIDYKPNDKWTISGQFPVKPRIMYKINPKLGVGIELNGEASSYRVDLNSPDQPFLQITEWSGLARFELEFAKNWKMNVGLGRNLRQSFRLYNEGATNRWTIITIPFGDKPEPVQKVDSRGFEMQVGISFRLQTKK